MENIRNLELARVHNEIQKIITMLKQQRTNEDVLNAIDTLETLETRLHNLAYGDCQFVHHLPYPVKPTVKRGRNVIFPKCSDPSEDVA